jgi:hypothetical protein
MRRYLSLAAALVLLGGCDELDGITAVTNGASIQPTSLSGRWVGDYSSNVSFTTAQAVMELTQTGGSVTGTLTINGARTANVGGTVTGNRFTGNWSYTDSCGGNANTTADLLQNGTRLSGTYTSSDCLGVTTGGYNLTRQP